MLMLVCGGLLLVFLGLLLGATWNTQVSQPKLRRQAEERRRLNEEWAAIRTIRRERNECPRCASPLYEWDGEFIPRGIEERPDDDYVIEHYIA
jgi:hypothetical protein